MGNLTQIRPKRVLVELDKERELKFDLNAFAELETRFGTVEKAMEEMQSGSMKSIRTILWIGLIHEEAVLNEDGEPTRYTITPYQVGSWITPANLQFVSNQLTVALGAALPDETKKDAIEAAEKFKDNVNSDLNLNTGVQLATVTYTEAEKVELVENEKNA